MSFSEKKVILITGAGSGIGKKTAKVFLNANYFVIFSGRNLKKLNNSIKENQGTSENSLPISCDVGNPSEVEKLFKEIKKKFKRLDVLFNNAGIFSTQKSAEKFSHKEWQKILNTNVNGPFFCAKEAIKIMKKQSPKGGRIINNGSISAHSPRPLSLPYTVSKHAMTGLTKSIALDYRNDNILCSQIDIGNASTEITNTISKGILQSDGTTKKEPVFDAEIVAKTVFQMATLPSDSNILFLTIIANKMPYIGRG
tara:strand:+ start:395 stop:1156 length:762 start_codon:yes stop_codon:yes gene_type:complete